MKDINYDELDPGIRDQVRVLREHGFDTVDSGDGVSKPADHYTSGCAMPVPHVVAKSRLASMITDAHLMANLLGDDEWVVQASYTTDDQTVLLLATKDAEARR